MIEGHINEEDLQLKITTLFDYRMFPELISLTKNQEGESNDHFISLLIELQKAIYYLDAHLEANWTLDEKALKWNWNNIFDKLGYFGIPEERFHEYVNHIKKYEKHETELRQGKTPLRFDMEYFYFYKSCDVKLLRRLIFEKGSLHNVAGSLSEWRYYDLVTEVNDDVEDVFEDLDYINGNRFLLSLHSYGKKKTKDDFSTFLNEIKSKANARYAAGGKSSMDKMIHDKTMLRIEETLMILGKNIQEVNQTMLKNSKLLICQNELKYEKSGY